MLAVARHEGRRAFAFADRRTAFTFLGVALLLGASWPLVERNPLQPDAGLYPVAVDDASPYRDAIASDHRFRFVDGDVRALQDGRIALLVEADRVLYDDERTRSLAALQALGQASRRWLEDQMRTESDQAAAFPVEVNLLAAPLGAVGASDPDPQEPAPGGPTDPGPTPAPGGSTGRGLLVDEVASKQEGLAPSEVEPPFPVRSLLLTFSFLIPMNLVAQLYAGSLLADRTRDRGLILLSAPLSGAAVLVGRTLPYVGIAVLVAIVAAWATGAGLLGFAAALPMVLVVVAVAMVLGLLARNERELTFLLTGATTMLSTFLFLPAIFVQLPAIAFVSPVAVVIAAIEDSPVTWGAFLYATAPLALVAVGLTAHGLGLYREETLFSTAGLGRKALEGLGRLMRRAWQVVAGGALVVPFALALELFVLALVLPLGFGAALPLFIVGVAAVEEALKLLVARAHQERGRHRGWRAGALAGTGFFLGEKLALLVALAGFGLLPFGDAGVALWGSAGPLLLVAPLVLHAGTAAVAASALRRSAAWRLAGYLAAVVLHVAYNALVISFGGAA